MCGIGLVDNRYISRCEVRDATCHSQYIIEVVDSENGIHPWRFDLAENVYSLRGILSNKNCNVVRKFEDLLFLKSALDHRGYLRRRHPCHMKSFSPGNSYIPFLINAQLGRELRCIEDSHLN